MIIYKVTNLVNNKIYVGKTINTLRYRKTTHQSDAKNRKHNCIFHKAIRKYGEENFVWEIIDEVLFAESLIELEKYYIKKFESKMPSGYNMTDGGEGTTGRIITNEFREKLRKANTGKKLSKETIKKRTESRKYYRPSEETKRKISAAHTGKHVGEKNNNYGKHTPWTQARREVGNKRRSKK